MPRQREQELLEDILSLSRQQTRLLLEIRELLAVLRPGEGRAVPLGGPGEDPRDFA